VEGQVKITGGNPGNNKVLMCDSTGLASWQTAINNGIEVSGSYGQTMAYNGSAWAATSNIKEYLGNTTTIGNITPGQYSNVYIAAP